MRLILGLLCLLWVPSWTAQAATNGGPSRDLVLKFYQRPEQALSVTEKTSPRGLEVEVCSDYCDLFVLPADRKPTALWDAIILMKAFVSEASFDQEFGSSNADVAKRTLNQRTPASCPKRETERERASCALQSIAAAQGLRRAAVTYDEGNRCEAFATFKNPDRIYQSRCTKVSR